MILVPIRFWLTNQPLDYFCGCYSKSPTRQNTSKKTAISLWAIKTAHISIIYVSTHFYTLTKHAYFRYMILELRAWWVPSKSDYSITQCQCWTWSHEWLNREDNVDRQLFVWSYCSEWFKQHYTITPQGFTAFILPFEMLFQLPEQKLHCHLVMALHSYSPCSHGAVCQWNHIRSKVTEQRVPSFFVSCFLTTPRFLLNLQIYRSGSRPPLALASAAARGGHRRQDARLWVRTVHVCAPRVSSINVTHLCLNGWLVSEFLSTDSSWAAGVVWSCDPGSYVNHQQRLVCGPLISLHLHSPP